MIPLRVFSTYFLLPDGIIVLSDGNSASPEGITLIRDGNKLPADRINPELTKQIKKPAHFKLALLLIIFEIELYEGWQIRRLF